MSIECPIYCTVFIKLQICHYCKDLCISASFFRIVCVGDDRRSADDVIKKWKDILRFVCLPYTVQGPLWGIVILIHVGAPGSVSGRSLYPDTDEPVVMLTLEEVQSLLPTF